MIKKKRQKSFIYLETDSKRSDYLNAVDHVSPQRKNFVVLNSQNFSLAFCQLVVADGIVYYWKPFFGHNCGVEFKLVVVIFIVNI